MKRIMVSIIVLIVLSISGFSQEINKVAELDINTMQLAKNLNIQSSQFIFQSKQKTDFHFTFDISDILQPVLKDFEPKDRNSLIIIFENANGDAVTAEYAEFDNLLNTTPAVMIYRKVVKKEGDSISLQEVDGEMDMSELDESMAHFTTRRRIHLQIKNIPVSEKTRMLEDATVIFPSDLNTDRWINNVDKIYIYKYNSSRTIPEPVLEEPQEKVIDKKAKKSKKK